MLSVRGFLDAYGSQTTDFQFRAKSVVLEHVGQHATHKTVFISHKTADYNEAEERVGKALSKQGLAVYFVEDDSSVSPGDRDELPGEIKTVMRKCNALLVYASEKLVSSDCSWICFEVGLAEMWTLSTARYTTIYSASRLLSPIRCLETVEQKLSQWAEKIKRG